MIELTPLDVRKKRGDFRRAMRGYEPTEVDSFLDLVAERMEQLVKENMKFRDEREGLEKEVTQARERERAVQEALVTATELGRDVTGQAQREAELLRREAESEVERLLVEAEGRLDQLRLSIGELDRRRRRYLKTYRQLLEQELDVVESEEKLDPLAGIASDIEGFSSFAPQATDAENDRDAVRPAGERDGSRDPRYRVSLGQDGTGRGPSVDSDPDG